jgi:probable F420-dependent oxidoreductase
MQLGVSLEPPSWSSRSGELVLQTAQKAERLGFHSVLMSSHVLANLNGSAMDPLVLLSAVAGATSRIRIATSVLVLPYYNPVVLANQAATLDVISGGRFILGVGTGWNPDEFNAVGVPLTERGARTDEHLDIMKALWNGRPTDYEGRFTSFRQASIGISPRTAGGPPIWVGGHSDAALRRALRFADGWHGGGLDHLAVAEIRQRLATLGDTIGRDPATFQLTSVCFLTPPGLEQTRQAPGRLLGGPKPTAESILNELGLLEEAGISMCSLWMPVAERQMTDALDWIAEEIMPDLDTTSTASSRTS